MTMDRDESVNADLFSPARSQAEWEAQGWSLEAVEATAGPRLETMISVRFNPDDALLIRSAARASGLTKSEFVRRAAL
ncbi:MAG TPA: hypothetical protein VFQ80_07500, partial [Thermomicrobiales bacterium]|nr:hypothetical protein [Thermomicrobiales bacterium]